jgi:hypothetical protein
MYTCRELAGRDLEIEGLLTQLEDMKHGAEINDKSVEIMKVKDDRLAWFEGEVAHLRDEVLYMTNLRGDNAQLKEWLEAERAAHLKHLEVYKKTNSELMRENRNLTVSFKFTYFFIFCCSMLCCLFSPHVTYICNANKRTPLP